MNQSRSNCATLLKAGCKRVAQLHVMVLLVMSNLTTKELNNAKEMIILELKAEYSKSSTSAKRMKEIMQELIQLRCEIMNSKKQ